MPSPSTPSPGSDPFYSGGYSIERHGALSGDTLSSVQIECHYAGVRDTTASREAFAHALADALITYLATHFGVTL